MVAGVAAGAAAARYVPPRCPACGRTFDSRFDATDHIRSTHPELYEMRTRVDRRAKWLLAAIFVVGGLVIAPSQLTNVLRENIWGGPVFIGLLVLIVPLVWVRPWSVQES